MVLSLEKEPDVYLQEYETSL